MHREFKIDKIGRNLNSKYVMQQLIPERLRLPFLVPTAFPCFHESACGQLLFIY